MRVTQYEKDLVSTCTELLPAGFKIQRSSQKRLPARASYDLIYGDRILAENMTVSEGAAAVTAIANLLAEMEPAEETLESDGDSEQLPAEETEKLIDEALASEMHSELV